MSGLDTGAVPEVPGPPIATWDRPGVDRRRSRRRQRRSHRRRRPTCAQRGGHGRRRRRFDPPAAGGLVDDLVVPRLRLHRRHPPRWPGRPVPASSAGRRHCPRCRRSTAKAKCCGARSLRPPPTSSCSSTPTWSPRTPCSCRNLSDRSSPTPESELVKGYCADRGGRRRPAMPPTVGTRHRAGGAPPLAALRLNEPCRPTARGRVRRDRALLASLPFGPGYGVEGGLLIDTHEARGRGRSAR